MQQVKNRGVGHMRLFGNGMKIEGFGGVSFAVASLAFFFCACRACLVKGSEATCKCLIVESFGRERPAGERAGKAKGAGA